MKNENFLDRVPKTEGFSLPESYFDHVGNRVLEEIRLREAMPVKEGFTLPEGYIAAVDLRLKSIPEIQRSKVIFMRRILPWTAVAAVLVLIIWLGQWKTSQSAFSYDLETLSQTEIQNYLEKSTSEWDAYVLGDLFNHEQLEEIALGDIPISEDEMMQYLLEQEAFPGQP